MTVRGRGESKASRGNPTSSRAREDACLPPRRSPATYPSQWAGSPLKRARKQGVRLEDGRVVAFPYMPCVADLPPGWRHFTTAQKIDHLIGLDRWYEISSWGPYRELDPLRRSFQMQVLRVFLSIGLNAMLNGTLDREVARARDGPRLLDELDRKLRERADQAAGANGATTPAT